MTVEPSSKIVRTAGALTTTVDKDIIILNMATSNYVALDEIGRRIWNLIEQPILVSDVCAQLAQEYAGDPQQITADVLAFLSELLSESLAQLVVE